MTKILMFYEFARKIAYKKLEFIASSTLILVIFTKYSKMSMARMDSLLSQSSENRRFVSKKVIVVC